jgi:hypothetical protein
MIYALLFCAFLIASSLLVLSEGDRVKGLRWVIPLAAFVVAVPACRFHTGWDWEAYEEMLNAATWTGLGSVSGDYLFDIVLAIAQTPEALNALTSTVIVCGFVIYAYRHCPSNATLAIALVMFMWYGYFCAWSAMRQGMAIVFVSFAFSAKKTIWQAAFFIVAILLHKTAALPAAIFFVLRLPGLRSIWSQITLCVAALALLSATASEVRSDVMLAMFEVLLPVMGEARAVSFGLREFLIEPYPLLTGRMVEILMSIAVLLRLGRTNPQAGGALATGLARLQIAHVIVYLMCSPLTFLAERMVLFFDFVHCAAVANAAELAISWAVARTGMPALRRQNMVAAGMLMTTMFVNAYLGNRYITIFSTESREAGEASHFDRFFPYRSVL